MTPVEKALWFVEAHFAEAVSLDDVARTSGVSRFHLVRAFGAVTGRSVMRYVRSRRLSEAARVLVNGAPDILSVALDWGYGSHEAFTRAFRDEFGITPETLRANGLANLNLTEPTRMNENQFPKLPEPKLMNGKPLLVAGLSERYNDTSIANVPAQWQRFAPFMGNIVGEVPGATYGVCYNGDDEGNVDYLTGVEVKDFTDLPRELTHLRIPAQRYAKFAIADHISSIRMVWRTIWGKWLPESGRELADAPFFERYGTSFNPQTGAGGFEIWLPLKG